MAKGIGRGNGTGWEVMFPMLPVAATSTSPDCANGLVRRAGDEVGKRGRKRDTLPVCSRVREATTSARGLRRGGTVRRPKGMACENEGRGGRVTVANVLFLVLFENEEVAGKE